MFILFPTSSAFCWYLTLAFKEHVALNRAVTDTHTDTHTQQVLEPHPRMCEVKNAILTLECCMIVIAYSTAASALKFEAK